MRTRQRQTVPQVLCLVRLVRLIGVALLSMVLQAGCTGIIYSGVTCGDDVAEGLELCDGPDLGGQDCASLGFSGGSLACTASCAFDTSGCTNSAVEVVCNRWNADRADLSEGTWSGSVASCNPGDISANGRANALKLVNLYRWLADLPAVTTNAGRDQDTQACALMMHANGQLSHSPPSSWTTQNSTTYTFNVTNITTPVAYDVQVVNCN